MEQHKNNEWFYGIKWFDGEEDRRRGWIGEPYNLRIGMVHCDPLVLHAPGLCLYCDQYGKDLQDHRIVRNINFTGEKDPNKMQCPAEAMRGDIASVWDGNKAKTAEQVFEHQEQIIVAAAPYIDLETFLEMANDLYTRRKEAGLDNSG